MKSLLVVLLVMVLTLSGHGQIPQNTVNALLDKIRAELPKGWSASYDGEYTWLEVTRDAKISSLPNLPNGSPHEKPAQRNHAFAFRIDPFVSIAAHHRMSAENSAIRKEATAIYDELVRRGVSQKFDHFLAANEVDQKAASRYEALKESLHSLPDFYFRDISLSWQIGSPDQTSLNIIDEGVRDQCAQVRQKVLKLLSDYKAASLRR